MSPSGGSKKTDASRKRAFESKAAADRCVSDELTILATEHAALQATRSTCLQDMQGRATLFLTAVSGTLVALGFIGGANRFGPFFVVFAVTLLFLLWVLGSLTFLRIAQIGVEDTVVAFGLSRIRHRYVELIPGLQDVLVRSIHDDLDGIRSEAGAGDQWWQGLMPTQSLVSFVVSVVGGCEVAVMLSLLVHLFFAGSVLVGIAVCIINLSVLTRVSSKVWAVAVNRYPAKFPRGERSM
jgi:hypothetical protein